MELNIFNWRLSIQRVFHDEATLAAMYSAAAPRWGRSIDRMGYLRAYDALFARLTAGGLLSNLSAEAVILDAGIGTGEFAAALQQYRPLAGWHGIDISPDMLRVARQRLGGVGCFRQANLVDIPYNDASFDLVLSAHALEHLEQPEAGMRELLRVLKPGQPFVIVATRPCPVTRLLSLRWNFRPMPVAFVCEALERAGAECIDVQPLMPRRFMAYMSVVYSGIRRL